MLYKIINIIQYIIKLKYIFYQFAIRAFED
jgi:hypothetical protein